MSTVNWKEAKQMVAEKHGLKSWGHLLWKKCSKFGSDEPYLQEVAELMCNEAVKADRKMILSDIDQITFANKYGSVICNADKVRHLPLPFPEKP